MESALQMQCTKKGSSTWIFETLRYHRLDERSVLALKGTYGLHTSVSGNDCRGEEREKPQIRQIRMWKVRGTTGPLAAKGTSGWTNYSSSTPTNFPSSTPLLLPGNLDLDNHHRYTRSYSKSSITYQNRHHADLQGNHCDGHLLRCISEI